MKTPLWIENEFFSAVSRGVVRFVKKNCGNSLANSEDGGIRKKQVQKSWQSAPIKPQTVV
jgi:hypothetical protein